ncbi:MULTISPECIES: RNA polymerase sigma factor [Enterococcus]|uniref:Sigma-70 family RNA polymerase sigma factor n=1 Tax=Enterococcus casseliflavus TaxID=37734 RepID=A0ABD6Z3P7_ENTCA|nr:MULTISPECIES: sigma-70 family RNA polymerase sigma factor [Enterococcus]NSW12172.1 sigma-70 family RNA polymerase sigma factor [Enterococcus faecalis]QGN29558.1 sigma-70 family RNA polymerase sigma factor [Enterococcus casseliflavus]TQB30345.1 sigma-70 family RNA polymerase sigma factor [Enterococcus faecalis]
MNQSFETHISHVFDAYCKKVLRNELRNIHKQYAYVRDKQISITDLTEEFLEQLQVGEKTIENSELFEVAGLKLRVEDLYLADALNELEDRRKMILLLFYFAGFNDREISELLNTSLSTVWYQRKKAEVDLKKVMEAMKNG